MVACTKPKNGRKKRGERLREEGDKVKHNDLRFEGLSRESLVSVSSHPITLHLSRISDYYVLSTNITLSSKPATLGFLIIVAL